MSAPAMEVVGERESGVVVSMRVLREEKRVSWTRRKGRYWFASEGEVWGIGGWPLAASAISMSEAVPFCVVDPLELFEDEGGGG